MSDPAILARAAERLGRVPGFMAFELARYKKLTKVDPILDFDLPGASTVMLGLCRRPRAEHYAADLAAIAAKVGADPTAVANLLRAIDSVAALASRPQEEGADRLNMSGLLAAARDHGEEHTGFEDAEGREPTLPGWLIGAVDRFWGGAEQDSGFPRDLHVPILMGLPLAIVEIDDLKVRDLDRWLRRHQLPLLSGVEDRPLRGCLVAYAGVGLLFVDREDGAEQRRVTLAHEAAHFVVDYLIPREKVARRRPDLLEVLDGDRPPTDAERFDALLADVPVGFHTHLLERDALGGHVGVVTTDVEDRAERLALELLAPLSRVLEETAGDHARSIQEVLRSRFGLPTDVAARYTSHVGRYRTRHPRSLLEAIGLETAAPDEPDATANEQPETDA